MAPAEVRGSRPVVAERVTLRTLGRFRGLAILYVLVHVHRTGSAGEQRELYRYELQLSKHVCVLGHLLGARLGCLRCASRNTSWPASRAVGVSGSTFIVREKRSRRRSLRRAAATPPFCYSGSHAWGPEVQVVRVVLNSSSSTKSWLLCSCAAWGCNALESQGCVSNERWYARDRVVYMAYVNVFG